MKINNLNVYTYDKIINDMKVKITKLSKYEDFKVLVKVFSEAPFYEKCTEEDMEKEFETYQGDKGGAFILYDKTGKPVSGCLFEYGVEEQHKDLLNVENPDLVGYISGMTTVKDSRGCGYNTAVLEHTLNYFKEEGFKQVYLRTNKEGSMSEGIAFKHGFKEVLKDGKLILEQVEFDRIDPTAPKIDERKLLIKQLTKY